MAEQSEEIAQRLRERAEVWRRYFPPPPQRTVEVSVTRIQAAATECDEAADEIERLRERLDEIITAATSGAGSAAVYAAIDRAALSGRTAEADHG